MAGAERRYDSVLVVALVLGIGIELDVVTSVVLDHGRDRSRFPAEVREQGLDVQVRTTLEIPGLFIPPVATLLHGCLPVIDD
jgi:hypothetical protein